MLDDVKVEVRTPARQPAAGEAPALRLLLLTPEFGTHMEGGLGTYVGELVAQLTRVDVEITVGLVARPPALIEHAGTQPSWRPVPAPALSGNHFSDQIALCRSVAAAVYQRYASIRFDLVHSHDWLTFPAGERIAGSMGLPHVTTVQWLQTLADTRFRSSAPDHPKQALERRMLLSPTRVIVASDFMARFAAAIAPEAGEKIHRIHNWIDPHPFDPDAVGAADALRHRLAPGGQQLVLFAGRLTAQKGLEHLLASIPAVLARCPDTRWIVLGGPAEAISRYQAVVPSAGRDHVRFLGPVPRSELRLFYRAADCVVVPSIYEPFGYVALEAMATGTPPIVSAIDGLREIVEHDVDGLHVPFDGNHTPPRPDPLMLAAAQCRLLTDHDLRQRLARSGCRKVSSRFSPDSLFPHVLSIYHSALKEQ